MSGWFPRAVLVPITFFLFLTLASGSSSCCRCLSLFCSSCFQLCAAHWNDCSLPGKLRLLNRNRHLVHAPADWRNSSSRGVGRVEVLFWSSDISGRLVRALVSVRARVVALSNRCREARRHVATHRGPSQNLPSLPTSYTCDFSVCLPAAPGLTPAADSCRVHQWLLADMLIG